MVRSFPSFPHGLTFLSKRLVPNLKWTIENGLPIVVTIVYESISFHFSTLSNIINEAACREKLVSCRWFWIGQVTKAALTRRILGGLRKHLFGSPTTIQLGKKTLPGFRIRELKENGHFFWWCHDDDVELGRRRVNLGGSMIFILVACESLHIEQQACLHDVERGGMCVVKMVIDMGE